jgi:hypothetical protein
MPLTGDSWLAAEWRDWRWIGEVYGRCGYLVNTAGSCSAPVHGRIQTVPFQAWAR